VGLAVIEFGHVRQRQLMLKDREEVTWFEDFLEFRREEFTMFPLFEVKRLGRNRLPSDEIQQQSQEAFGR
jgi:hypothetical protein